MLCNKTQTTDVIHGINWTSALQMGRLTTEEPVKRRDLVATIAAIGISGGMSSGAAFQAPDFSGQWVIDSAPPAAPAGAPAGRPDQGRLAPGDMGSGWGSPLAITQDAKQLRVEPAVFSRYDANPQPRFVYALDGTETRNEVMIGHTTQVRLSRAEWDGQSLRITTRYPGVDPASGKPFTIEVTQRLSLETPTTLIVEVSRAAALGGRETATRTVYRKN